MNTFDPSSTVRARIGLVELPELAGMLENAGLQTITAPGFREAATAIKEGFKESTFPIVVADAGTPGLRAWIQRIHNTAASAGKPVHIAVLRDGGDPIIVSEDVIELRTPLTLNQVLAAVKIPPIPGGEAVYPAPVAVPAPESAGIDFEFDFDEFPDEEPAQVTAVQPVPVVQAPVVQQAPAAQPAPWETPAADPAPEAAPAPAAALPWETPAPAAAAPWEAAPAADQAPTTVEDEFDWGAPAPTTPSPAVDEGLDWGTPAQAPAPVAPVETSWDEPAPAAAPSAQAPAVSSEFEWDTPAATSAPAAAAAAPSEGGFEWDSPAAAPASGKVAEFEWDDTATAPVAAAPTAEAATPEIEWGTPATVQETATATAPATPVEDEWDSAFPAAAPKADVDWGTPAAPAAPAAPESSEWDSAFPAPAPAPIDWGTPAVAQTHPVAAPAPADEPAPIDWGTPATAAAPAPADEPATIDWGTPATAAAPVPETDRPEPRPEQRTFTPAPPAAAQTPVPVPVVPVQQVQPAEGGSVHYLDPAQQQGRYAAPAPVQHMTHDWPGQAPAQQAQYRAQPSGPRGELIVDYSGKGGVGKSTTSLRLATIAADAGLKVILIDGNAAQGDLRTYMKLHRSNLPTIYDAAFGDVSKAVLHPDVINENREPSLGRVNFAFVAAAPDEIYDKDIVTDAVYGQVINYARHHADLVILDTQIVEAADRSGVVDDIILPALIQDGWGIGISDMSSPGVNNLNHRLHKFISSGVPTERLMVLLNRVPEEQVSAASKASGYFKGRAKFLGVIEEDFQVSSDMNAGRMQVTNTNLNAALNEALYTITGNEAFVPVKEEAADVSRSIFKRFFGSGKKEVA